MATHAHIMSSAAPGEPTRRRLMSAFAGGSFAGADLVIAAPSAAEAHNPDAELIAACERFASLESEYDRLCQVADWPVDHVMTAADQAVQDEFDGVSDEQHEIGEWLAVQRSQTPAGMRAKAQAVIAYGLSPSHDMISRLVASLVQDVAEERAA